MKKSLFFLFAALFSLLVSCEIGMGRSVDLEAPVLEILSPAFSSYTGLDFEMSGTCSDNIKVTAVVISNKVTGTVYGNADIVDDTWSFQMHLAKEEEGELTLLVEAKDATNNTSTRSARTITLLVDEHAPEGLSWYVDRGNSIQTPLKPKTFLENLDLNLAVNNDYPQNEKFTIHSTFYDAMNIDTITLKLYEDEFSTETPIIEKTVNSNPENANFIGEGISIYTPSFTFTHDELVAARSSLNSGKHYLRVAYYAKDNDSLENYNEILEDLGLYILWYPESDLPGIQQIQTLYNELNEASLSISVGDHIPVDFFDDDGLKEAYCSIRKSIPESISSYTNKLISSASARATEFNFASYDTNLEQGKKFTFSNNTTREEHVQINAPGLPGQMYLVACTLDVNDNWNARIIKTDVTDENKPLLFIETPSENTIPDMKAGSASVFQIKGYSLDTKGSDYIRIAYIPDSDISAFSTSASKEDRAKELFETYASNTSTKLVIPETGEVIWYKKFKAADGEDFNGWNKQSFVFDLDLTTDFKDANGNTTAKDTKFFEILLVDSDQNPVYKQFIINGDSTQPGVEITNPPKELYVHDYEQSDLVIKFKGSKKSGLGMDNTKYKVETTIDKTTYEYSYGNGLTVDRDGYATVTIPKATVQAWSKIESQPTFTFYTTDILGNGGKGEGQRSVILSTRPSINSITIDKNNGTYKKGDVLKFKVSFSKQVKVSGKPKLILKYSADDTVEKYAEYEAGSGSNTLTFSFTVPAGADSQKLICEGLAIESENVLTDSCHIQAMELGEGDIFTSIANAEVLAGKEIKLDGISPVINKITVRPVDGNKACTKDKEIEAIIEATENVLVSGSPALVLNVDGTNISFTFQKMSGKEITFVHTVKNTDPQGLISYNSTTSFSATDAKFIKDEIGNVIDLASKPKTGTSEVSIDYTAPASAPSTNLSESSYSKAQTIELSNIEENATAYYSKDGGVSWKTYDAANKETIGSGSYKIVTRQSDTAGNMSVSSAIHTVVINNNFAPVTGFNVDIADGYYKENTEFTFTLSFDDNIVINSADDVILNFESIGNSSIKRSAKVNVPAGNKASSISFSYKVTGEDFIDGLKVTSIDFANTVVDTFGNEPAFATTPKKLTPENCAFIKNSDGGNRAGISLDGIVPTLIANRCAPLNGGISTLTSSSNCNITLVFSEKVYKEEGDIILRRKGNWAIPAVLTSEEFRALYNKMTNENREKLMITESGNGTGNEALDDKTAQPVGPYKKITHGLKLDGYNNLIPDSSTKYVLDFQYDLYTGDVVSDIRDALKSIDYDKHFIDVNSSGVTLTYNSDGTTSVSINFPEDIEDGREWELIIPAKAFRDNAENFYAGMNITGATDTYSLWSNKVAKPVVRVDRYSHGWGAVEPYPTNEAKTTWATKTIADNDMKFTTTLSTNSGRSIAPTGYARVRIDCETPDVTINYITKNSSTATASALLTDTMQFAAATENVSKNTGKISAIPDASKASLETSSGAVRYTNGSYIYIGDGSAITARKDYVSAKATKANFTASDYGYEGIFKTVIYCALGQADKDCINIEGGTAPGGEPSVSGFPLRDGTAEEELASRYSKNAYKVSTTDYTWVTYEIVSTDFSILPCRNNHASSYGLGSYGQAMYITDISWESNG